jgi:hypothetical protein
MSGHHPRKISKRQNTENPKDGVNAYWRKGQSWLGANHQRHLNPARLQIPGSVIQTKKERLFNSLLKLVPAVLNDRAFT